MEKLTLKKELFYHQRLIYSYSDLIYVDTKSVTNSKFSLPVVTFITFLHYRSLI